MTKQWYILLNNEQKGPYSWEEMLDLAGKGDLTPRDNIWKEGMEEWAEALTVEGLFEEGFEIAEPTEGSQQTPYSMEDDLPPAPPVEAVGGAAKSAGKLKVIAIVAGCALLLLAVGVAAFSMLSNLDADLADGTANGNGDEPLFIDPFNFNGDNGNDEPDDPLPGDPLPTDPLPVNGGGKPGDRKAPAPPSGGQPLPPGNGKPPGEVRGAPVAVVSIAPNSQPRVGDTVQFVGVNSYSPDPAGRIAGYSWSFHDGSSGSGPVYEKAFNSAGHQVFTLTVTDEKGNTGSQSGWVTVSQRALPPDENGDPTPGNGEAPDPGGNGGGTTQVLQPSAKFTHSSSGSSIVSFDATRSKGGSWPITSYNWNFGDRSALVKTAGPTVSKNYDIPGTYTVTLTVINSKGQSATYSASVEVRFKLFPGPGVGTGTEPDETDWDAPVPID